ncbi:poly [ADP-ribose] polymerase [[Emmonsia] crescens]|uniref:Poly [ADP-ribose] polymerase n=1 Tax=[Emmonsia] crescens TaxID=73230 RepID=A0A2B7Z6M3_9EURO|nr:poly [ADP-ribose] polymerase [Emmonsia crescens]
MASTFKNHIIALSGTFPMHKQAVLIDKIESGGGTYSPKLIDTCTHLVTTQKDVDDNKPKCKQAASIKGIKIVSWNWLLDSAADGKPASETSYLLTTTTAPIPASNGRPVRSSRTKQQPNGTNASVSVDDNKDDQPTKDTKPSKGKKQTANSKTKRPIAADDDEDDTTSKSQDEPPVKKQKDAQKASSPTIKVPVDENSPYRSTHEVFIEKSGLIYDAALNQTNASYNNNKFYLIQLLVNKTSGKYTTWTRWGRVGENGQSAAFPGLTLDEAKDVFDKKFKTKTGLSWSNRLGAPKAGKYTFIERNYEDDSDDEDESEKKGNKKVKKEDKEEVKAPECTLSRPVQELVGLIFNQQYMLSTMASMSYDAKKLPLGKLSKRTLMSGFQVLKDLSEMVANPSIAMQKYNQPFGFAAELLSNQYFTLIPHVFGRSRPPVIGSLDLIKREVELLETLTDMEIANEIMKDAKASETGLHPLDVQFSGLGLQEMTPVSSATTEYKELEDYLVKSHGQTHHISYKLKHIFRVERLGEKERFEASPFANLPNSNRRLLWHGSRSTNYGGILSQGLRIAPPEAPVTGYMFGKGVYFADISSKSANYCCSYTSGNIGVLMLCDVELGNPMLELVDSDYNAGENAKKKGCLSTLGKGQTVPQGWKDASCVNEDLKGALIPDVSAPPTKQDDTDAWLQYNEYIVYDVAQIRVKYLLYVHMS